MQIQFNRTDYAMEFIIFTQHSLDLSKITKRGRLTSGSLHGKMMYI